LALYNYFVTALYAGLTIQIAMLFMYNGLTQLFETVARQG